MADNVTSTQEKGKSNGNGKWMTKTAASAGDQVTHFTESARDIYGRAMKSGGELISKANRRAGEVVREHPVQAAVGGLILGFILGMTVFRRRN